MFLSITTTRRPATDLGYLLHKHPAKLQTAELPFGKAHIFYPQANEDRCTAVLLLDIDPVALVRKDRGEGFTLDQYVNDRPYSVTSFLSSAIAKVYSSALNGNCKDKPELVNVPMPFTIAMPALSATGGESMIRRLFEPLGYSVNATALPLDTQFPEWGMSRYSSVELSHDAVTLKELLTHLYVLIPVMSNNKHYFMNKDEVDKLLAKGGEWLAAHPEQKFITRRYLGNNRHMINDALLRLAETETVQDDDDDTQPLQPEQIEQIERKKRLHDQRLEMAAEVLVNSGAETVADLGCGEGRLIKLLLPHKQFKKIIGVDVSQRELQRAARKLRLRELAPAQAERLQLFQSSVLYRDQRLETAQAVAVVEVIEHLEPERLSTFAQVLFGCIRPQTAVITTPNAEYNVKYETLTAGDFRHDDHRFEWTRAEFAQWANAVAEKYGYTVKYVPVGETDEQAGAPSQAAIFTNGN
ncbi:MAG: 3' terminal RNA ribose 2'-O-methyltransferase Hen1 [Bacteroidia bacterium]|jgi:3' terminal RNA ribose 2'-O-methyltransferase Hen1|nr:3' terminal RNA ribose 2'-O-methyltransferase Hen1 [Bacteroidia bacterium]